MKKTHIVAAVVVIIIVIVVVVVDSQYVDSRFRCIMHYVIDDSSFSVHF